MKLRFPFQNGIIDLQKFIVDRVPESNLIRGKTAGFADDIVDVLPLFCVRVHLGSIDHTAILCIGCMLELVADPVICFIRCFRFQILLKCFCINAKCSILGNSVGNFHILLLECTRKLEITNGSDRCRQKHNKADQGVKDRPYERLCECSFLFHTLFSVL